jgi:hypothetical protein
LGQHAAPFLQHLPWSQHWALSQQAAFPWQQVAVGVWLEAKAVITRASESKDKVERMRFMKFS